MREAPVQARLGRPRPRRLQVQAERLEAPVLGAGPEVPDPQALAIRCLVNGEALQDSTTAEMVFGVAEVIAFISEAITLEPMSKFPLVRDLWVDRSRLFS